MERLPDSTTALVSELRDRALAIEPILAALPFGAPVSKIVGGQRYWYLQSRGGGLDHQRYLGAESPALAARLARWRELAKSSAADRAELQRLNEMAVAGGVLRESAAATRVLELLAEAGLFRAGGVLVGTRAFTTLAASLGFRAPAAAQTQDIDVALHRSLAVSLPREGAPVGTRLGETEPPFLPVPDLDPRRPSTSFKLRGRELRVDFVTPRRPRDPERPVPLSVFGVAAWPLPQLDFLTREPLAAVTCGTRPVLVRVPDPARVAVHKLWLAAERPAAEAGRARKDRTQAALLLEVLIDEQPTALATALAELQRSARAARALRASAKRLDASLARALLARLDP